MHRAYTPGTPPVQTERRFAACWRRPGSGPSQPPAGAGGLEEPRCHGISVAARASIWAARDAGAGRLRRRYFCQDEKGGSSSAARQWPGTRPVRPSARPCGTGGDPVALEDSGRDPAAEAGGIHRPWPAGMLVVEPTGEDALARRDGERGGVGCAPGFHDAQPGFVRRGSRHRHRRAPLRAPPRRRWGGRGRSAPRPARRRRIPSPRRFRGSGRPPPGR